MEIAGAQTSTPKPNLAGGEEEARRPEIALSSSKIMNHEIRVRRVEEMLGCHLAFPFFNAEKLAILAKNI